MSTLQTFLSGLAVGAFIGIVLGFLAGRLERKQAVVAAATILASTPLFGQEKPESAP